MTTKILDSLENETECVGLSESAIDNGKDSCKFSVYMIIFCGGFIHAPCFRVAMSKPWKCETDLSKCTY